MIEETQDELFNEIGRITFSAACFRFYEHKMQELKSKFTITRKTTPNE